MAIWSKDGNIAIDGSGNVIDCADCPCGSGISTDCCSNDLSDTLTATITNSIGCDCADGETITLNWDGSSKWTGSGTVCGQTWTFELTCTGSTPEDFNLHIDCSGSDNSPDNGSTCDPVDLQFTGAGGNVFGCGCDSEPGTVDITITE